MTGGGTGGEQGAGGEGVGGEAKDNRWATAYQKNVPAAGANRNAPTGILSFAGADRAVAAGNTASRGAGFARRGKSGLHGTGRWVTPTRRRSVSRKRGGRKPRASATENEPPNGELRLVRGKGEKVR